MCSYLKWRGWTVGAAVVLCLGVASSLPAGTWFVKQNATGANNGSSWSNAFTNLDTALSAATEQYGDDIIPFQANYRPGVGANAESSFLLKPEVRLHGNSIGNG